MQLTPDHLLYANRLASRFIARHDVRDSAADDILSAALFGLVLASRRYDASRGAKFETYAFVHMKHRMGRAAEYAGRLPTDELTEADGGTWDDLDSRAFLAQVADAIRELPPKQRVVAWLYFFEDASPLQIEERTGIGQRAVQFQKELAVKALRARLQQSTTEESSVARRRVA